MVLAEGGIRTRGTTASGTCCGWILQQLQTHLPPWLAAALSLKNNHFTLPSNRLSKNSIEVWRFNASRPHGEAGYRDQDLCDRSTQKSLGISVPLSRMPEADVRQRLPGGEEFVTAAPDRDRACPFVTLPGRAHVRVNSARRVMISHACPSISRIAHGPLTPGATHRPRDRRRATLAPVDVSRPSSPRSCVRCRRITSRPSDAHLIEQYAQAIVLARRASSRAVLLEDR